MGEVSVKLASPFEPIDLEATYAVVTNSFIAGARDGYYEFGEIADELKVDSYVEYAQSFIEYIQDVGILDQVLDENASTQKWADATNAPTVAPSMAPTVAPTVEPTAVQDSAANGMNNILLVGTIMSILSYFLM